MKTVSQQIKKRQQTNQTSLNNSDIGTIQTTLAGYGRKQLAIVNHALSKANTWHMYFQSHQTIANELGVSVDWVQRSLRQAKLDGIIEYKHRFDNSNVYRVPKWFYNKNITEYLADLLPALRGALCVSMLLVCTGLRVPQKNHLVEKSGGYLRNDITKNENEMIMTTKYTDGESFTSGLCKKEEHQGGNRQSNYNIAGSFALEEPKQAYQNPKEAAAYKDFLLNRFDSLVKLLATANLLEKLELNCRKYYTNLSYSDKILVETEVYKIKQNISK